MQATVEQNNASKLKMEGIRESVVKKAIAVINEKLKNDEAILNSDISIFGDEVTYVLDVYEAHGWKMIRSGTGKKDTISFYKNKGTLKRLEYDVVSPMDVDFKS